MNPGTEPCTVVVVDDSAEVRDLLRIALARTDDFTVVAEAPDGARGLDAVVQHRPGLVLLDLAMPVMNGLETLLHIRDICPQTRVVMLSGSGASPDVERALAGGAVGYVQKGMAIRTMLVRLRTLVGLETEPVAARRRGVEAWNFEGRPAPPTVPGQQRGRQGGWDG